MAETAETPKAKPVRKRRAAAVPAGVGPTDISDTMIRTEAKKAAVWLGMAALLALAVYLAQPLLVVFGGMVFAAMIDGGARLLGRILPIGRGWRVALVLILALAFGMWVFAFAGTQLASQAAQLPQIVEAQAMRGLAWLKSQGIDVKVPSFDNLFERIAGGVGTITSAVGGVIGGLTTAFLIMVMAIYFALEPQLYRRGFAWLLPQRERAHFQGTAEIMGSRLRRLLFGRLIGMAVEGVATWLALMIYGVPMSGLLGLLTGLLAFLPNIGAPISGLLMVLVGFSGGTEMGLFCIGVYVLVQTIDGYVIVPMVAKRTADLAPALVLGMQLIMGALFGILGLMLADPLVAMIKVMLERQSERNEHA